MNSIQSTYKSYTGYLRSDELFDIHEIEKTKEAIERCRSCMLYSDDPKLKCCLKFLNKRLSIQEAAFNLN